MSNVLKKEIWIAASLDRVFNAFTKAEAMLAWHGKEVEVDPVPGGIYKVVFEDGTVINGSFISVEPLKSVEYSARYGQVDSLVKIRFIEENGGVTVKIRQEFTAEQDTSSFDHGWNYFLNILKVHLDPKA